MFDIHFGQGKRQPSPLFLGGRCDGCFDETLILIKRTLGWADAPYYLPELVNKEGLLSPRYRRSIDIILERNELDIKLHEFAKNCSMKELANQDPDFNNEVRRFKALNAEYIAKRGLPSW